MPKKRTNASEPTLSSGPVPARARKHAPAKHTSAAVAESSPSIVPAAITITATKAETIASNSVVTSDAIAKLAYSYWEARGYQGGSPEEDWLNAERELLASR